MALNNMNKASALIYKHLWIMNLSTDGYDNNANRDQDSV